MGEHGCHRGRWSTLFLLKLFNWAHFQCAFNKVDFRIVYDDDVYGARIIAEGPSAEGDEEYNVVCNHLIGDTHSNLSHYILTVTLNLNYKAQQNMLFLSHANSPCRRHVLVCPWLLYGPTNLQVVLVGLDESSLPIWLFFPGHSGWNSTHLTLWPSSETCLLRGRWISNTLSMS